MLGLVKQLTVQKILIFAFEQKDRHIGVDLKMGQSPLHSQGKDCILKLPVRPESRVHDGRFWLMVGLLAGQLVPIVQPHVVYSQVSNKPMIVDIMDYLRVLIEHTSS